MDKGKIRAEFEDLEEVVRCFDIIVDIFILGEVAEWGSEGDIGKYIQGEVLGEASEID